MLRLDRNLLGAPFELALPPRDRKLGHLAALEPDTIVSATIGCIQHLRSGTPLAVMPSATGWRWWLAKRCEPCPTIVVPRIAISPMPVN